LDDVVDSAESRFANELIGRAFKFRQVVCTWGYDALQSFRQSIGIRTQLRFSRSVACNRLNDPHDAGRDGQSALRATAHAFCVIGMLIAIARPGEPRHMAEAPDRSGRRNDARNQRPGACCSFCHHDLTACGMRRRARQWYEQREQ
jgi:hypothetical protein